MKIMTTYSEKDEISKKENPKKSDISSKVFFTSDLHLGHAKIIEYSKRPFKNVGEMNEKLIENWNNKVNPDSLVYHVGDFCFGKGTEKQYKTRLNGDIVHIQGNHDTNNGVKTYIAKCIMHFGGKSIFVQHRPPSCVEEIPFGVDFALCGHVHNLYRHKWVGKTLVINVSCDVWGFQPIDVNSILKYYNKIMRKEMQK